jgi:hypothetical protein
MFVSGDRFVTSFARFGARIVIRLWRRLWRLSVVVPGSLLLERTGMSLKQ